MSGLNPIDSEELYDRLLISGVFSPGFVTLSGHDREYQFDVKESDGKSGSTAEYKGEKTAQFVATFQLVKDDTMELDEFAEWDLFQPMLEKSLATKPPSALAVYHPDLARNGIWAVSIKKIGGMQHDGQGGATVAVEFLEHRPPKAKGGSPKPKAAGASEGGTGKAPKVDPNADLQEELAGLDQAWKNPG